jgi:ankyrin repeat protein
MHVSVCLCSWTALHIASRNGHTETVKALVMAGADVHCKSSDGYGLWLHPRVSGLSPCGANSPSNRTVFACAARHRCTMRRRTATWRR